MLYSAAYIQGMSGSLVHLITLLYINVCVCVCVCVRVKLNSRSHILCCFPRANIIRRYAPMAYWVHATKYNPIDDHDNTWGKGRKCFI